MKETDIRNEDGSYKPEALEVAKKSGEFIKQLMSEHPDMHPDHINFILSNSASTHCGLEIAFRI